MRKILTFKTFRRVITWAILVIVLMAIPRLITTLYAIPHTQSIDEVDPYAFAIVLGAETEPDGSPSAVTKDRVQAGVDLYNAGKADKLLMSGSIPQPETMRNYAIQQGVPGEDVWVDELGVRTYATCYQAKNTFMLDEVILVTQNYHLPRALFICRSLGIDAVGVASVHGNYWPGSTIAWNIRESLATILAFKDVYLGPPADAEYLQTPASEEE